MATEVGIISALIGSATATATDGTVRNLQVGDKVYPNEIITTGFAGAVEVEFTDGSLMDLGRNTQAVLDNETFDFDNATPPAATTGSDVIDDIEAIQQALLEGADPTAIADPTAAGPGAQPASEGGSDAVVVDYLAPRVTPQAGFDTTGPGVSFLDPPPFQFLVDDSDDSLLPPGELPPEPLNTPPVADPVLTSYQFAADSSNLSSLPSGSYVFQQFSVGGGVDESEYGLTPPTKFEAKPSLGGDDGPDGTPESLLTFTLTAPPSFGTLYKKVGDDWIELKAGEEGSNTFNASDSILWSATQGEFNAYIATTPVITYGGIGAGKSPWVVDGLELTAITLNGVGGKIAFDSHGIGVAGGTIVPGQLEHRDGKSEQIVMKFGNPSTDAEITISRLIVKEKEVGQVEAFLNGDSMGLWTFTTANGQPLLNGEPIDFSFANENLDIGPNGADNAVTFKLEGVIFDQLVFSATEYVDGASPQPHGDSSDYYIQSISVKEITEMPGASFEYAVTDESGNISDSVVVEISAGNDTVVGNDGDNLLSGGPGDDILTGGEGKDIFVWNAGDEGTVGAPANDTVTDFNIVEGDVLDFSDILVGEKADNLTDFIFITEDGADIVIELKPDAKDVTQKITLQGISLADFGMGGYDIATQQADIIKKLVQDGHVNVDS